MRAILSRIALIAALILLGAASQAWAAVSVQSSATANGTSVTTVTSAAFNPGVGSNRLLVVGLSFGLVGVPGSVAVTYGGVTLLLVPGTSGTNGNAHAEMWYLPNPSSVPANIVATWTGNHDIVMGAVAFNGANQVTPVQNGTFAIGTSVAPAVTITSAIGDMTMDTQANVSTGLGAPTRTPRWLDATRPNVKAGGSTAAGAAPTVTHAWTAGSSAAWVSAGVDIKAVIGFAVGSFMKSASAAPATQVIAHGLGQAPKAVILWTEGRSDTTFSGATGITFRAAQSAGATTGVTTLTINVPTGTLQNDVMVASVGVRPDTVVITAPTGWTLVRRVDNTTGGVPHNNSLATYWKVAGASEPASYDWTFDTSTGSAGGIQSFTGVDTLSPIDVENGQATPNSLSHDAPSVTTTGINEMIVTAYTFSSSASWTTPTGMTQAFDVESDPDGNGGQATSADYVLQAAVGATGINTATASLSKDLGNTETLALRPAYPASFGFGFSDGTTSGSTSTASQHGAVTSAAARRMAKTVITIVKWDQTLLAEATLQSWDATNFTLNWTTNGSFAYVIHYLVIGGSDVSAKVVNWQMPTVTGNKAVTGVGFQPTAVIHIHAGGGFTSAPPSSGANGGFGLGAMDFGGVLDQWATSELAINGVTPSDTQRGQRTDAAIYAFDNSLSPTKKASFVSMDASGFTMNFTSTNANADQVFSLALLGVNVQAGSFLKSTGGAPASQSITGLGFQPGAVLLHSFQDVAQPTASAVAHARMGLGASDGVTEGSSAVEDLDAANPTNVQGIDKTSKAFMKVNNATPLVDAEADLTSMDPDGFTLNWTTNDAAATQILYLALAPLVVTEVKLVSFTATTYAHGALLQWRTGSELNNLGFNLYREVKGVRTKVNPSLIAGSGLVAGRGAAVNAAETYARWDLDRAATSGVVVYWLEDLDFSGKSTFHGPVTPVAGALNAPEPTVALSGNLNDLGKGTKNQSVFITTQPAAPGAHALTQSGQRLTQNTQPLSPLATQWTLAAQPLVKIGIRSPGWYRVTQADLVAAGLNAGVDSRTLRLFVEGTEQAIRVTGNVDGSFVPGDAIEFYGTGVDTPYTDTRVYFLASGGSGQGLRIGVEADAGGLPAPASFWSTVQRKDRSIYFAALENGEAENWFGELVSTAPTDLTLTADHLDPAAPGPSQLTVTLQGVNSTPGTNAGHQVGVFVNGTQVGELDFQGQTDFTQSFPVPAAVLLDGDNDVTLTALGDDTDISLVDLLQLNYWHTYEADADLLYFTVPSSRQVTIGGFASPAIQVVDITDPSASSTLPGTVQAAGDGSSSLTVQVAGAGPRTLLAFSDLTIGTACGGPAVPGCAFVQPNHPSTWHAPTRTQDYVVISHGDFLAQVYPLAALREQQGHRAAMIDVQDVYDEFSFGEKTPQALKDFLLWARGNWQTPPHFVVLVGDATIDPRDYAQLGAADFVPTKQVSMVEEVLKTASDDWFVDFNGDGLPDIPIGRLSVRTAGQAAAVVAKIVGYDQAGPQPWTKEVLLVADQDDDTSNFEQSSAELAAGLPGDYSAKTIFRGALGDAVAHQSLIDSVNSGQLLVNYAGHGSVHLWGLGTPPLLQDPYEGQAPLPIDDVRASWHNATRLPFVVAMNCLNGLFDGIYDEESLAETLQRAPDGGAVAVWASSASTTSEAQAAVNLELFRLIFQGTYSTVGEAVAAAKRVASSSDVRRSWVFFGDPAMRLSGTPQPTGQPTVPVPTPDTLGPTRAAVPPNPTTPLPLGDFDGDKRADITVFRPSSGMWYILQSSSNYTTSVAYAWGVGTDLPVPGDYDGDGKTDLAVFRPSNNTFYILESSTGYTTSVSFSWGLSTDIPVPADYDGDGKTDPAVYRPSTGQWLILTSSSRYTASIVVSWGLSTDVPLPADYDGDGKADPAVYRPSTGQWFMLNSSTTYTTSLVASWGLSTDIPVPGDYDGDGLTDPAVYRPSTGQWLFLNSSTGYASSGTASWGVSTDIPTPGDYDGNRQTDPAVYRPSTGTWFILHSSTHYTTGFAVTWGLSTDTPINGRP